MTVLEPLVRATSRSHRTLERLDFDVDRVAAAEFRRVYPMADGGPSPWSS